MVEILYYADGRLENKPLGRIVKDYILKSGLPILSVTLKPMDFGKNIHYIGKRSHSTMFKQILFGLQNSTADFIFMCEHDVLYHPSHFKFVPPKDDVYYYNNNVWKYRLSDRKVIGYNCKWLSQCCAGRKILIEHYKNKLALIEKGIRSYGYEPGCGQNKHLTNYKTENWESEFPNVDIRHRGNWTGATRMSQDEFKNKKTCQNWQEITVDKIPGWDKEILLNLS